MAVPCPGCGRGYDVALFQFGRTLHCACGTRVALAPRVRPLAPGRDVRFSADAMLGRLARWLRFLGHDTLYDRSIEDAALVRRAIEEDRIVLTRDRALGEEWSVPRILVLESEALPAQLRQVVHTFGLDWTARRFTRCSRCNAELSEPLEAVVRRAPPTVRATHQRFAWCRRCDRLYWDGSHVARMHRVLEETLGPAARD